MATLSTTINGDNLMRSVDVQVRVTFSKQLKWRIWFSKKLLRLAQIITPFKIEYSIKENNGGNGQAYTARDVV